MRRNAVGQACLIAAGLNSILLGAYHFVLPAQMQWHAAMDGVSDMIRWALFALNFDFSLLIVFVGILAWCAAASWWRRSAATLACAFAPAAFWIIHWIYLRVVPLPIPDELWQIRVALEGFTIAVITMSVTGALLYAFDSAAQAQRITKTAIGGGVLLGVTPMLVVFLAIWSWFAGMTTTQSTPAAPVDTGLAGELGLDTLETLVPDATPRPVRMAPSLSRDQYLSRWSELAPALDLVDSGETDAALAALDAHDSAHAGAINLRSSLLSSADQFDEARKAIDEALTLEPSEHLHHHQDALMRLAAIGNEPSMMAKWRLANEATAAFERALESNIECLAARLYLIYATEHTPAGFGGDPARAMRLLNESIDLGLTECIVVRAYVHFRRDETEAGLADAERAFAAGFYHDAVFTHVADLMLAKGDTEQSLKYASFGVRMNPNSAANWVSVAAVLSAREQSDRAIRAYEIALEIDPEHKDATIALAALRPVESASP